MNPMQHVRVDGFGSAGIVRDIAYSQRTMQMLHNATNVRIQDGQLSSIPANQNAQNLPKAPVFAHPFFAYDESGGHVIVYEDNTVAYWDSGGNEHDITPTPAPSANATEYWYATQVNDIFVLTNGIDPPWQITQAQLQSAGALETMPNWQSNYRAKVLEPLKGYLVAADLTIDGVYRKGLIKWSHPLAPGDEAFLWDHTDPTILAGENELSVKGRDIRALQPLRDQLIIYLDQEVWRMTEVGGGYVFGFSPVFKDDGIVGAHAWCEADGKAIVCGFRDIYIHDGHNRQSLSDAKIGRWWYRYARIDSSIQVCYYPHRQEVFILYRTNDDYREFNAALIYNIQSNAFTVMELPGTDSLGGCSRMYMGLSFGAEINATPDIWSGEVTGTWDDDAAAEPWNKPIVDFDQKLLPFMISRGSQEILLMDQASGVPHQAGSIYVDTIMQPMWDVFPTAGDKIKYLSRIYPRMQGVGVMAWSIGTSQTPADSVDWKPWRDFYIGPDQDNDIPLDRSVDVRGAGHYLSFRLRMGTTRWAAWTLSGLDMELLVPQAGRR